MGLDRRVECKTDIKREANRIYFCSTDKDGNIKVESSLMARFGKSKKK